ncbi:MAG: phosphocholine cytidylyltransferase family protein [Cyclobacteriaceae bacterium]
MDAKQGSKTRIETAIILAAGKGTRLRPYTHDIPKGFMKVGEETLIGRSVRILKENGIKNILIGTGHLSEHYERLAKKEGLKTFKNPDFSTTGSFHTLSYSADLIDQGFLLLESDLLYHSQAISSLVSNDSENIILCSGFTASNDEVYVESHDGYLKNLSKNKAEVQADAELVGIWKISGDLFKVLMKHHENAEDATTKDYEIAIANSNHPVTVLKIEDLVWCEIDNEEHLERAKNKILPLLDQTHA